MHRHTFSPPLTPSLAVIPFTRGGFQEARGTSESHHPGNWGGALYLSHRVELLDTADEWYLHRPTGPSEGEAVLYLAVANETSPPETIVAPILAVREMRLRDIRFRVGANSVVLTVVLIME